MSLGMELSFPDGIPLQLSGFQAVCSEPWFQLIDKVCILFETALFKLLFRFFRGQEFCLETYYQRTPH